MDPFEIETRQERMDYLNRQLYNALQRAAAAEHRVSRAPGGKTQVA